MKRALAGFTLVELLVVVTVIAILISMLLPALKNARETARMAVCASNQSQMGTAIAAYRLAYRNQFPPYLYTKDPDPESTTDKSRTHQLFGIRNWDSGTYSQDPVNNINMPDFSLGFLASYAQVDKLYYCPSYKLIQLPPHMSDWQFLMMPLNSYALNLYVGDMKTAGSLGGDRLSRLGDMDSAASTINYADSTGWRLYMWWPTALDIQVRNYGNDWTGTYVPIGEGQYNDDPFVMFMLAPYNRHFGKANFLMCDSHVEAADAADYWYDEYWVHD